jgi:glycosyltransferase involved in cell wall biosynthesis
LQRTIPRICARERADALLCLGNFGPRRLPLPTIVLLHNAHYLSIDSWPSSVRRSLRERLITWYAKRYLRRLPAGVHLVVQTQLMKQRLMETHGVPAGKVSVLPDSEALPPAASEPSLRPAAVEPRATAKGSAEVACLPSGKCVSPCAPFTFLCLARYYPHKNLEVLLEAMKRLSAHSPQPARCLLTIHPDQHPAAGELLRRIASEGLEQVVINLGPFEGTGVTEAYQAADAFILPSLLESFGRVYFEAIRFDLPLLTSNRDFAREVCGGAALYFDPLDPDNIAQAMARIMTDSDLRDRLAAERRQIAIPSWDEVAARFVELLERTAAEWQPFSALYQQRFMEKDPIRLTTAN